MQGIDFAETDAGNDSITQSILDELDTGIDSVDIHGDQRGVMKGFVPPMIDGLLEMAVRFVVDSC